MATASHSPTEGDPSSSGPPSLLFRTCAETLTSSRDLSPQIPKRQPSEDGERTPDLEQTEFLIGNLDQGFDAVKVTDSPQLESVSVRIPPGFPLGLQTTESVLAQYRALRDQAQSRKGGKVPPPLRNNGFAPCELLTAGGLHMADARPSDLRIYEQLLPGLRLASMFLTTDACLQFFVTLAFGRRVPIRHEDGFDTRIPNDFCMTRDNVDQVKLLHRRLAETVLFHFKPLLGVYASVLTLRDYRSGFGTSLGAVARHTRVDIHTDWYYAAHKFSLLKHADISQKLPFNLAFAVTICHEVAHATGWVVSPKSSREPFMYNQNMAEVINARVDAQYGLMIDDWPGSGAFDADRVFWAIRMEHVQRLQQTETWDRIIQTGQRGDLFHFPRDGASAMAMGLLDMKIFSRRRFFEWMEQDDEEQTAGRENRKRFVEVETLDVEALLMVVVGLEHEDVGGNYIVAVN
ncbi:MAG: hypothetical protein M1817_001715 [Caeruleum heppii]|nr:MAG: hypothetical protein M1817_001715 [Caeruleum heppii]